MLFSWPFGESKRRSRSSDRRKQKSPSRVRRWLGIDPLEQRQLLAVSIAPAFVTVAEGNLGTVNQVFTVTLDAAEATPVTVNFQTNDGVGAGGATVLGNDYFATSGTLTFNPAGPLAQAFTVQVRGDTIDELDETFTVTLSSFTGTGGIIAGTSTVTIDDDDGPAVSINDVVQLEGNGGVTPFVFRMVLSNASVQPVSVVVSTNPGTATPAVDYTVSTGTITFVPGITQQDVTVNVLGDTSTEINETFFVDLSNATNGTIADPQGLGTIVDDELPTLSINDVAIFEGNDDGFGSFRDMVFQVTMSRISPTGVTVEFATADGTPGVINTQPIQAVNQADFTAASGLLSFAPGETIKNVTVKIKGENIHERDETFFVNLFNALGGNIFDPQAVGTIVNDDQIPQIVFSDVSAVEDFNPLTTTVFPEIDPPLEPPGVMYTRPVSIGISLSNPSSGTIIVDYQTISETAVGINNEIARQVVDYRRSFPNPPFPGDPANGHIAAEVDPPFQFTGQVTFTPGQGSREVVLRIFKDVIAEADETFILRGALVAAGQAPAGLADDTGRVTIVDDDPKPSVSINNASIVEGDSGQTFLVFTVTRGAPISEQLITVNYTTLAGTASPGVDYTPQTGTLSFQPRIAGNPGIPGTASLAVSVPIFGDFIDEADETLTVQLSNPVNATIGGTGIGNGLILDDDGPVINVDDVTVLEGDSGTVDAIFTVSLSGTSVQPVTVGFVTSNVSASAGADYVSTQGTLTYAPGESTKTVTVRVNGDTLFEGTEFFLLNLTTPDNATINDNIGQGVIQDDDVQVTISIADASLLEGNSGLSSMVFSLTLSQASNAPIGVNYSTFSNSALASSDFAPIASNIVFPVGVVQQFITVSIFGDTNVEPDESFFIILSNPTNATITDGTAIGTILDDDAPPNITIDDIVGIEGDPGTTPFVFTISLSKPAMVPVSVVFNTADGSATSPADYSGGSGTLQFTPGETTKQVTVTIINDGLIEAPEAFFVNLSNPTQAFLTDNQGVGSIIDDDSPFLRIFDESIVETDSGSQNMVFRVTMSRPELSNVTVEFTTANISAAAGSDYSTTGGTLLFAPGSTEEFITVPVLGDTTDEIDETFSVTLFNPVGGAIFDGAGVGTIDDNDGPTINITDVVVTEGNAGLVFADFTIALSFVSAQDVTVEFATADGTALGAGIDYFSTTGTLTFTAGQLAKTLRINVLGDTIDELDETYFVALSNAINATIVDNLGLGTITDDDAPGIFINDTTVQEQDSGLVYAVFQLGLTAATIQPVTVVLNTADNTALQNLDYFPTQLTLTFQPAGPTLQSVSVQIVPDSAPEPDEQFFVNLTSPTGGATFTDPQALATIFDDDTRISIGDATIVEGNTGTQPVVLNVTMNQPRPTTVTVQFTTSNGTAVVGQDFNAISGVITFLAGQTSQPLTVQVRGDLIDEPTESFDIVLSNPVGAFQGDFLGTVTITDNGDPQPTMSITNLTVAEGNAGTSNAVFTVLLSGLSGRTVTGVFNTANVTAIAGADYTAATGTVSFLPGETSKQIIVPILGDQTVETNETFQLNLSGILFATPPTLQAVGTIVDDDASLSISSTTVVEGNATVNAVFTVTLSKPTSTPVTMDFATANGTAIAGLDYNSVSGTISFAAGQTSTTITVQVLGDTLDEDNESFSVNLTNIVGAASVTSSVGTATILDEDPAPNLSISDTSVTEGDSGTINAVFTVSLSQVSGKFITVAYTTNPGSAADPGDYQALAGTLTFFPGESAKPIQVPVNGDLVLEPDETFFVDLVVLNGNANAVDAQGMATILDDEARMSISDGTLVEGNSGTTFMVFGVTLTKAAGPGNITVNYNTVPGSGSATAGSDYLTVNSVLTFFPGDNSRSISVPVIGDVLSETDETFTLFLSSPVGAILTDNQATGTIVNDDPLPVVAVTNVSLPEGDAGPTNFVFTVTLDAVSGQTVTVQYATANGVGVTGAQAPSDYQSRSGTLTFLPGDTSLSVTVPVNGDPFAENDENFFLNLSSLVNGAFGDNQGVGTIVNDEPQFSIGDAVVIEQDSGAVALSLPVTLSRASSVPITVVVNTAPQTAGSPLDYTAISNSTLAFAAGQTSLNVVVQVQGDLIDEDDETFVVNLTNSSNGASILDGQAVATIMDNDAPPTISISSATTLEGNAGTTNAVFAVSLSGVSGRQVTVNYLTADNTATVAGLDYLVVGGALTFTPGTVVQNVTVAVRGDTLGEGDETYFVNLSGPVNAAPGTMQGVGLIVDDEPRVSINDVSITEGDTSTLNMIFTLTLSAAAPSAVTVSFNTQDGTATSGADYLSASGVVTFQPGSVVQTATVAIVGDLADEDDEQFTINLSGVSNNASILDGVGIGTIGDNDIPPAISITGQTVDEGDSGPVQAVFTISLSAASGRNVTVAYATADVTAFAPGDYTAVPATTLTFVPGEVAKTVTVLVNGDIQAEQNESFEVRLSSPVNATLGAQNVGLGVIRDDEPRIFIDDVAIAEGNSGPQNAIFNVRLSNASTAPVSVVFNTSNGSALATSDYAATSGTLVFTPSQTQQQITVQINGDVVFENNEAFVVNLTSPSSNALISDGQAQGLINNDDTPPVLSIAGSSLIEGDLGSSNMLFTVTMSPASGLPATVAFSTAAGGSANLATAGTDFTATSGSLSFAVGETVKTITVRITGDLAVEQNETFLVNLSAANGAVAPVPTAVGTILDNDAEINIGPAAVTEGNAGITNLVFPVTLSKPVNKPVTANFATSNGTGLNPATAGVDYFATNGSVNFAANEISKSITVQIVGEAVSEPDETLLVTLSSITGALAAVTQATGTIFNDDGVPNISINDVTVIEGNSGTSNAVFTITLDQAAGQLVAVVFNTADGSAVAGQDYLPISGAVSFNPGQTVQQVTVPIVGDTTVETRETFSVSLSSPTNGIIVRATGAGTIEDNEQTNLILTGAGPGGGPHTRGLQSTTLAQQFNFYAYNPLFSGGVRVASADVNGDGQADMITAPGSGGGPHVKVFDGRTGLLITEFYAFESTFSGGLYVAAGDTNLDGRAEVFVGAEGPGSNGRIRVFNGVNGAVLKDLVAPAAGFATGVRVGAGDVNGDGRSDVIIGASRGNTPRVMALDAASGAVIADFFAYNPAFLGGIYVAAGDVNGDGLADIVTGADAGGGPHVKIFDGATRQEIRGFYAYGATFSGGVRVATTDFNGDGLVDIITGAGPGGGPHVRIFRSDTLQELAGLYAYNPVFGGGVYVAGSLRGPGSPLRSSGHGANDAAASLTDPELQPLVNQAVANWMAARPDAADRLRNVNVGIADLPSGYLAMAYANAVYVDIDADRHGWFVDATPGEDEEFQLLGDDLRARDDGIAAGKMDLLTVIAHELGHVLGLDDLSLESHADLMAEALSLGARRSPGDAVDAVFGSDEW